MTGNEAKIWTVNKKSLVEVRRKSAKMLDLRAVFMIWADWTAKDVAMIQIVQLK